MLSEKLFSLARMARRLGVSQKWLREEARAARVPCLAAGRDFLFEPSAVESALAERASACSHPSQCDSTDGPPRN